AASLRRAPSRLIRCMSAGLFRAHSFFFSSRRRHTRWPRDWSSDVCSSDLPRSGREHAYASGQDLGRTGEGFYVRIHALFSRRSRSEERRVGKECRSWWWPDQSKKKGWAVIGTVRGLYETERGAGSRVVSVC